MAHQYIFTMKDLRQGPPAQQGGAEGHLAVVLPGREDRRARRATAPASARCCASWPASTRSSSARRGRPTGPRSATCRRSRSSIRRKTVHGERRGGGAEIRELLQRFDEVNAKLAEELVARGDGRSCSRSRPSCRTRSTPPTAGSSTARSRSRWTRCAARPATPTSPSSPAASGAASRSAGCSCPSRTCCCSTSRPTTSTPSRSRGSSSYLQEYPGTVVAVTHDRYFLDNVAGWILELDRGAGIPWEGNYSSWLEQKRKRLAAGGEAGDRAAADARARARVGAHVAARAPGQEQGAPRRLRDAARRRRREKRDDDVEIAIPPGPAPRRRRRRRRGPAARRYGDHLLIDDLTFTPAARRHRRRHRRRTAPARRRCSA